MFVSPKKSVIPVKMGIHAEVKNKSYVCKQSPWIPVFTGMTAFGRFG
jgi:hypothetical protein